MYSLVMSLFSHGYIKYQQCFNLLSYMCTVFTQHLVFRCLIIMQYIFDTIETNQPNQPNQQQHNQQQQHNNQQQPQQQQPGQPGSVPPSSLQNPSTSSEPSDGM